MNKLTTGCFYSPCQRGVSLHWLCQLSVGKHPQLVTPSWQFIHTFLGGLTEEKHRLIKKLLQDSYIMGNKIISINRHVQRADRSSLNTYFWKRNTWLKYIFGWNTVTYLSNSKNMALNPFRVIIKQLFIGKTFSFYALWWVKNAVVTA